MTRPTIEDSWLKVKEALTERGESDIELARVLFYAGANGFYRAMFGSEDEAAEECDQEHFEKVVTELMDANDQQHIENVVKQGDLGMGVRVVSKGHPSGPT